MTMWNNRVFCDKIIESSKNNFCWKECFLSFPFYLQESTLPKDYIYKGNNSFLHKENLISGINAQRSLDYTLFF